MTAIRFQTPEHEKTASVRERAVDMLRQAAHISHEARLLKSVATDAVEEGVDAAKRAARRGLQQLEDVRDAAVYRVRRQPVKAIGAAFGVGALVGGLFAYACSRCTKT